jgi:hypothetical protein
MKKIANLEGDILTLKKVISDIPQAPSTVPLLHSGLSHGTLESTLKNRRY